MSDTVERMRQVMAEADCLYTAEEVRDTIARLGEAITERLSDNNPLVLCVMNGGLVMAGQLLPHLPFPLELDYAQLSRYGNGTTGGELKWKVSPQTSLEGRTVLVIDDILDEGDTLAAIVENCHQQGASSVLSAVLVEKHHERKSHPRLAADFVGLETGDRYLFGFGMDYQGYWRNAPGIFAVKGL